MHRTSTGAVVDNDQNADVTPVAREQQPRGLVPHVRYGRAVSFRVWTSSRVTPMQVQCCRNRTSCSLALYEVLVCTQQYRDLQHIIRSTRTGEFFIGMGRATVESSPLGRYTSNSIYSSTDAGRRQRYARDIDVPLAATGRVFDDLRPCLE